MFIWWMLSEAYPNPSFASTVVPLNFDSWKCSAQRKSYYISTYQQQERQSILQEVWKFAVRMMPERLGQYSLCRAGWHTFHIPDFRVCKVTVLAATEDSPLQNACRLTICWQRLGVSDRNCKHKGKNIFRYHSNRTAQLIFMSKTPKVFTVWHSVSISEFSK